MSPPEQLDLLLVAIPYNPYQGLKQDLVFVGDIGQASQYLIIPIRD